MSSQTSTVSVVPGEPSAPRWHAAFLSQVLPVVRREARFHFRRLPAVEREEALEEATVTAVVHFVRSIERQRDPTQFASRLARLAVLHVRAARTIASPTSSWEPLSRYALQRRKIRARRLEWNDGGRDGWQILLVEDRKSTPADTAIARLDIADWLGRMTRRRRQIAEALGAGYGTLGVARQFRLSPARISQLRREFRQSWEQFQNASLRHARRPAAV